MSQDEKPRSVKQLARMGGFARARKYTKQQRSESARQAAIARWNAYREKQLRSRAREAGGDW